MPGSYHIDTRRRMIVIRAWGALTDLEAGEIGRAIKADPAFDASFVRLEDLRDVSKLALTTQFAEYAASRHRVAPPPRRAFVVASDVAYGMARMLQLLADAAPEQFLVTKDYDEACRWLGVAPDA
jgi:hypothetical protein